MPPKSNVGNSTSRHSSCGSAQSNKRAVSGTKEVFTGVCRIWSTMKACTVPTVVKSITWLTGIGSNIQVKRKYKTHDKDKVVKWWYILRAEEAVLNQLEQEWEKVQLQTSWKLKPCYKQPIHSPLSCPRVSSGGTMGGGGRLAWSWGGRRRTPMVCSHYLHARYVDQTFFVTENRSPLIQSMEQQPRSPLIQLKEQQPGATAQESTSKDQQPTQPLRQADVQLLL